MLNGTLKITTQGCILVYEGVGSRYRYSQSLNKEEKNTRLLRREDKIKMKRYEWLWIQENHRNL